MRVSTLMVAGLMAGVAIARPVDPADTKATKAAVETGAAKVTGAAIETATATSSAAEPTAIPEEEPHFIQLPTKLVTNVAKSIEYVDHRILALRSTVENTVPRYGFIQTWQTRLMSNHLRTPMKSLAKILGATTSVSKTLGLSYLTPVNKTDPLYNFFERPCNGTCLYEKVKDIVDIVDEFDHAYADREGMEEVDDMVHPVKEAAQALVEQLGGDEAQAYIDAIRGPKPEETEEEEPTAVGVDAPTATKNAAAAGTGEAEAEDDEYIDEDEDDDDDDESTE